MTRTTFAPGRRGQAARRIALLIGVIGALSIRPEAATAHPLGNFTTNTATHIALSPRQVDVVYVVDLAEIPALKVRQELGASSGPVPVADADRWRDERCGSIARSLDITRDGIRTALAPTGVARLSFPPGQAGLTTLRLECRWQAPSGSSSEGFIEVVDRNFPDRLGWREISVSGDGVRVGGNLPAVSPTDLLVRYPKEAVSAPLRQLAASFDVSPGAAVGVSSSDSATSQPTSTDRGNDGLTERFQSLLDHRKVTLPFAAGAMLLAVVLGGLHALAPGHGKTIIAAYALGRRGRTADIIAIGGTVAATHTVGIMVLGVLVSATTVVSPDRSLRWASVVSGVLVIGVGFTLLRTRLRAWRRPGRHGAAGFVAASDPHPHPHLHDHDHDHGHDHPHPHDHGHEHPHPRPNDHGHDHPHPHPNDHEHAPAHHDPHPHPHAHHHGDTTGVTMARTAEAETRIHPDDPRFIVTSHAHGGWSHDHVLPAPGSVVRRRELVMMGLAGGLVPSPSALVVLLGAIAVGRVPFGVALVVAYGIGLAATLVGAGLLIVRFERGVRGWSSRLGTPAGARLHAVTNALPLVSGFAIASAGVLLLARSVAQL